MGRTGAFLVMMLLFLGCTEIPDCQDTRYPIAQVRFYSYEDQRLTSVIFDSVFVIGNDQPLYEGDTLSEVDLRFDPFSDEATYLFYADSTVDTLVLSYRSKLALENTDCGPIQYFYDLEPLTSSFDSVALISTIADLKVDTNVEVYR
ncbi:MAG: DUF6452 family protein [Cyclobacteriaceae bacterium]